MIMKRGIAVIAEWSSVLNYAQNSGNTRLPADALHFDTLRLKSDKMAERIFRLSVVLGEVNVYNSAQGSSKFSTLVLTCSLVLVVLTSGS